MLNTSDLISIVAIAKPDEALRFYGETLGLELVRDDPDALIFRCNGRLLRLQKFPELPPSRGSVLGWEVRDIATVVDKLAEKGLRFERYDGMPQDELGVATFPNGDRVAWFLDPDGNILSIAELVA